MAPNDGVAAVFLDRDGTLMREVNYCSDPGQVEIFPGVPEALLRLKKAGYMLVVISNQAGIGRGYFTEAQYRLVEAEVERQIMPARFDAVYFCPDHPERATSRRVIEVYRKALAERKLPEQNFAPQSKEEKYASRV